MPKPHGPKTREGSIKEENRLCIHKKRCLGNLVPSLYLNFPIRDLGILIAPAT